MCDGHTHTQNRTHKNDEKNIEKNISNKNIDTRIPFKMDNFHIIKQRNVVVRSHIKRVEW